MGVEVTQIKLQAQNLGRVRGRGSPTYITAAPATSQVPGLEQWLMKCVHENLRSLSPTDKVSGAGERGWGESAEACKVL